MKTVLVVEDNKDLAEMFAFYLEKVDRYEVKMVFDGKDAYQLLMGMEQLPDGILLDMNLPNVSGEVIYAMLKERGHAPHTLICTGDANMLAKYKGQAGVILLAKPVTQLSKLSQVMAQVTGGVT